VNDVPVCNAAFSEQHHLSSRVRSSFAASAVSPLRHSTVPMSTATVIASIGLPSTTSDVTKRLMAMASCSLPSGEGFHHHMFTQVMAAAARKSAPRATFQPEAEFRQLCIGR
jgi:hypothetical protein